MTMTEQRSSSPSGPVRHPLFARMYARMAAGFEAKGAAELRDEALAGLAGRVVELGAGTGINFSHYPATVSEAVAVEPEPYLRDLAVKAAAHAAVAVTVVDGDAGRLPVDDASCDAGVASLVLCTVPDPAAALAELWRVIRPGGELRFFEHVRSERPGLARAQRAIDVVWPHVGGGCHASRATVDAIGTAGFEIESVRRFTFRPSFIVAPTAPHVIGVARRP
jgi:ubiquinone/menaquinone biosynthesis C-methylase UbiE